MQVDASDDHSLPPPKNAIALDSKMNMSLETLADHLPLYASKTPHSPAAHAQAPVKVKVGLSESVLEESQPPSPVQISTRSRRTSSAISSRHIVSRSGKRNSSDVFFGTPVREGHHNFLLMYDMLTGIRISVSRSFSKPLGEISPFDFKASHKLAFDSNGNELTPTSEYDFKFKDYCPLIFRRIREFFHVDSSEYLLSLTGKYLLGESPTSGKSGRYLKITKNSQLFLLL